MKKSHVLIGVTVLILNLFSVTHAVSDEDQMRQRRKIDFASGLLSRGMYEMAELEYKSFLEEYGESDLASTAEFQLGMVYFLRKDYSEAADTFEQYLLAHSVSEDFYRAKFRLAQSKYFMGQMDEAAELLKSVSGKLSDPQNRALAEYYRASAIFFSGDASGAEQVAREALKKHSETAYQDRIRVLLADIVRSSGNMDEALEHYDAVASSSVTGSLADTARLSMADIYLSEDDINRAEELIDAVVAGEGDLYGEAILAKVRLDLQQGRYLEAAKAAGSEKSNSDLSSFVKGQLILLEGNAYLRLAENEKARELFSSLLGSDLPRELRERARINLLWTFLESGEFEKALQEIHNMTGSDVAPDDISPGGEAEVEYIRARALSNSDRPDDALKAYREVITKHPDSNFTREAIYESVWLLEQVGDIEKAIERAGQYRTRFPGDERAAEMLFKHSELYLSAEDYDQAEAVSREALDVLGNSDEAAVARYQLAQALFAQQKSEQSLEQLDLIVRDLPEALISRHAHFLKGRIHVSVGDTEEAIDAYNDLLEQGQGVLYPETLHQLGFILYQEGQLDRAAAVYLELISLPDINDLVALDVYLWVAEHFFLTDQSEKAQKALDFLAAAYPEALEKPQVRYLFADVARASGEMDEAIEGYKSIIDSADKNDPYYQRAILGIARCEHLNGNVQEALDGYERALEHGDDNYTQLRARYYRANINFEQNRYGEAAKEYMMIAILFDDTDFVSDSLLKAARAFIEIGDEQKAADALEELKTRYPDSSQAEESEEIRM